MAQFRLATSLAERPREGHKSEGTITDHQFIGRGREGVDLLVSATRDEHKEGERRVAGVAG